MLDTLLIEPEMLDKEIAERSLVEFTRELWRFMDAVPFRNNWHIEAIAEHLEAVTRGEIKRLLINIPPRHCKSSLVSVMWPAWTWIQPTTSPLSGPQVQFMYSSYAQSLSTRDSVKCRRVIESALYQERWSERFKMTTDVNTKTRFENDKHGYRIATSVDGALTGEGGSCLVVDDIHNVREAESTTVRESAITWWAESMSTRLNDAKTGAYVVIMQRVHHRDLSGYILDQGGDDWVHLCLPAKYESDHPHVSPHDKRAKDGELLWPGHFPQATIDEIERSLGSHACTPSESPVLMSDLSLKPISQVKVGDTVIGFQQGETQPGASYARTQLRHSVVKQIYRYPRRPVVKLHLQSGQFARCTSDHRWWRKVRKDQPNSQYCPAQIGSPLSRVCSSQLPVLAPEDERLAGWLAGFYDGEGTVSFKRRRKNERPVARIVFYQGAGRNLPLCNKLEAALTHFGFPYKVTRDERKDPKAGVNYEYRSYTLHGKSLPLFQQFLHIVQPIKWRERMFEASYGSRFKTIDRVIDITPDGYEDVYALETETGNYVVWGLASSNSAGQLQQRPSPRSGGMFESDWWEYCDPSEVPEGGVVARGWDLAGTDEFEAKRSNASWTVGVKMRLANEAYYIEHVVRLRGSPQAVEAKILSTAKADGFAPTIDLPQDPGQAGKSQVRYLVRKLAGYNVRYSPESGSKAERALALSAQAEGRNVYLVRGPWNRDFVDEAQSFPGLQDDQIDAASRAFHRLSIAPVFPVGGKVLGG